MESGRGKSAPVMASVIPRGTFIYKNLRYFKFEIMNNPILSRQSYVVYRTKKEEFDLVRDVKAHVEAASEAGIGDYTDENFWDVLTSHPLAPVTKPFLSFTFLRGSDVFLAALEDEMPMVFPDELAFLASIPGVRFKVKMEQQPIYDDISLIILHIRLSPLDSKGNVQEEQEVTDFHIWRREYEFQQLFDEFVEFMNGHFGLYSVDYPNSNTSLYNENGENSKLQVLCSLFYMFTFEGFPLGDTFSSYFKENENDRTRSLFVRHMKKLELSLKSGETCSEDAFSFVKFRVLNAGDFTNGDELHIPLIIMGKYFSSPIARLRQVSTFVKLSTMFNEYLKLFNMLWGTDIPMTEITKEDNDKITIQAFFDQIAHFPEFATSDDVFRVLYEEKRIDSSLHEWEAVIDALNAPEELKDASDVYDVDTLSDDKYEEIMQNQEGYGFDDIPMEMGSSSSNDFGQTLKEVFTSTNILVLGTPQSGKSTMINSLLRKRHFTTQNVFLSDPVRYMDSDITFTDSIGLTVASDNLLHDHRVFIRKSMVIFFVVDFDTLKGASKLLKMVLSESDDKSHFSLYIIGNKIDQLKTPLADFELSISEEFAKVEGLLYSLKGTLLISGKLGFISHTFLPNRLSSSILTGEEVASTLKILASINRERDNQNDVTEDDILHIQQVSRIRSILDLLSGYCGELLLEHIENCINNSNQILPCQTVNALVQSRRKRWIGRGGGAAGLTGGVIAGGLIVGGVLMNVIPGIGSAIGAISITTGIAALGGTILGGVSVTMGATVAGSVAGAMIGFSGGRFGAALTSTFLNKTILKGSRLADEILGFKTQSMARVPIKPDVKRKMDEEAAKLYKSYVKETRTEVVLSLVGHMPKSVRTSAKRGCIEDFASFHVAVGKEKYLLFLKGLWNVCSFQVEKSLQVCFLVEI